MPRSLSRGLEVLASLNAIESASVADLLRALRLPRASLYRILETLCADGFVERGRSDHRYRLTAKVRRLSEGFSDDHYLAAIARPELVAVTRQLRWPVSLGMLSGTDIVVRASTDEQSPLAADRFSVGYRMPVLTTATGLCVLAHLERARLETLLDQLSRGASRAPLTVRERATLDVRLRDIRARGFCILDRRRQTTDATSIAVPVMDEVGVVRGAVTLRFAKAAVSLPAATAAFVPVLRDAAHRIAAGGRDPRR